MHRRPAALRGPRRVGTLAVLSCALLAVPLSGQARPDRLIAVTGQGTASTLADVAEFELVVQALAGTADSAMDAVSEVTQAIRDSMHARAIEFELVTTKFQISPGRNDMRTGTPLDHRAHERMVVRLPDAGALAEGIRAALRAGDVQVVGITFMLADDRELRERALEVALRDGRTKAQLLANSLGVRLGDLLAAQANDGRAIVRSGVRNGPVGHGGGGNGGPLEPEPVVASATLMLRFAIEPPP